MNDEFGAELKLLRRELARLVIKCELQREKSLVLQSAAIQMLEAPLVESGTAFAAVAPIERHFRANNCDDDVVVIAFSGIATQLSMPVAEFYTFCSDRGRNVFFVKDFQQAWYQRGLLGVTRNVGETVHYFRDHIIGRGKRLRCFGTSAGGYAAILYGTLLGAEVVVALSPQTILTKRVLSRFKPPDSVLDDIMGLDYHDLWPFVSRSPDTTIHLHYGRRNSFCFDSAAADHLSTAANVRLYPHQTATHNLAQHLKLSGSLHNALEPIFAR